MISIWNNIHRCDTKKLINSVINALEKFPDNYFDILESIGTLEKRVIFSAEYCHELLHKIVNLDIPRRNKFHVFIIEIASRVAPGDFFETLDLIGLSDLAEEISNELSGEVKRQIHRARIPFSEQIQEKFYKVKNHLDNTYPAERIQFLMLETNALKLSFRSSESHNRLTASANKFAVITWLWVQHCNRNTIEIRNILTDMTSTSWPTGVDPILSQIVFESKMAVVSAMEGSFDLAKGHRRHAKLLTREYHDPLTKSLVFHDSRYVSQILSRNNVDDTTSVSRESKIALKFLESESNGNYFCIQMIRSFLLYLAEHNLHIGNDFQMDPVTQLSVIELERAKAVLYVVRERFQCRPDVERRREMVYNVCVARLHEAQQDQHMAIAYLCEAQQLARNGAFFEEEKNNIAHHISRLQNEGGQHVQL